VQLQPCHPTFPRRVSRNPFALDTDASTKRAAAYVDKILRGAKPDELPIEQPTKFQLVINNKIAKSLGLDIRPSLLAIAHQVID
jgi:putative tryptophan/tyrosine transport system substrate-binding protein